MSPFDTKARPLILALTLTTGASCGVAHAGPLSVQHVLTSDSYMPLHAAHYRRAGLSHVSPWQAPYHTSRWYRGGAGAKMGLVAQGIILPPRRPTYAYPGYYWNNYFYYPNYRDIYEF